MHLAYNSYKQQSVSVVDGCAAGLHTLLREIGRLVALLHDGGLIHGDLTTSNMLIRSPHNSLVSLSNHNFDQKINISVSHCRGATMPTECFQCFINA